MLPPAANRLDLDGFSSPHGKRINPIGASAIVDKEEDSKDTRPSTFFFGGGDFMNKIHKHQLKH